jgi:predicted transcriptional regulator
MKTLTIALKTSEDIFDDAIQAMKEAMKKEVKNPPEYMITFTSPKEFDKFLKHIKLIRVIKYLKPESVYELAKVMKVDVSNLNKSIQFLEDFEVITVKTTKKNGRTLKKPIFDFDDIRIKMAA